VHVEPLPLLTVAVLAMAGSLVGQRLLQRWSGKRLQRGFSLLLLLIGGVMLAEAARDFARLS
jgi:Sulfite exporter TauE/SafE.